MTIIKFCGFTRLIDIQAAIELDVDLIGLNFYAPSPRAITAETAAEWIVVLRKQYGRNCPLFVGVFANETPDNIVRTAHHSGIDVVQLSGDESIESYRHEERFSFYRAIRAASTDVAARQSREWGALTGAQATPALTARLPDVLIDAYDTSLYGGTGHTAEGTVVEAVQHAGKRIMLAGGLTAENVARQIAQFRPWGVDVASGIENGVRGVKDLQRMSDFVQQVRSAVTAS